VWAVRLICNDYPDPNITTEANARGCDGGKRVILQKDRKQEILLGDEAVALGAIHAGVTSSYAYPGTPSTEIVEYMARYEKHFGSPHATWCTNEKTAFEEALGVSFVGRRSLVAMKHVGLNVAADPFINSALVQINGGVVVAVADDPGMHSSQNEQDTRYFADFARVLCLEPATQQEAYEMTREAFDLSEKYRIPVVIRLVTRIAHSRAVVYLDDPREQNPLSKSDARQSWILLPGNARVQNRKLLDLQPRLLEYTENAEINALTINESRTDLGVITTGIGRNYYRENLTDLENKPSHLHVGAYPMPVEKIRKLAGSVDRILVLEEGYPYVERFLRGILPTPIEISGKMSGEVKPDGELDPDSVRLALGLPVREGIDLEGFEVPGRPPQLCAGCPHGDSYGAIRGAVNEFDEAIVTSDIGCYTLGALPPYSAIETCVCMGASIGIAKGAAEAGYPHVVAVIGDSTFLHSGTTPLMDAVSADANMTVIVLDNETVAMTGAQETMLPSTRLENIILAIGVNPDHYHVLDAHPKNAEQNRAVIRQEILHDGLSVIVSRRSCIEWAKHVKKQKKEQESK
jgi:indolepyruvate ferredoxin oxidoreductase alpha subunit